MYHRRVLVVDDGVVEVVVLVVEVVVVEVVDVVVEVVEVVVVLVDVVVVVVVAGFSIGTSRAPCGSSLGASLT